LEKARLDLPTACITAPAILPDGRMFLTSAGGANRKGEDDLAGALFLARLQVAGVPEHRSRLAGTTGA
jgi:sugar lactone lactonase YvrE